MPGAFERETHYLAHVGLVIVDQDATHRTPSRGRRLFRELLPILRRGRRSCNKSHDEFAAAPFAFAANFNGSPVQLDHAFNERETDAESALSAIEAPLALREKIEHMR